MRIGRQPRSVPVVLTEPSQLENPTSRPQQNRGTASDVAAIAPPQRGRHHRFKARLKLAVATTMIAVSQVAGRPPLVAPPELDACAQVDQGVSACTTGNAIQLRLDGSAIRAELLAQVEQARESIWINVFEWQDETTGTELADALLRARARGVDVRLVVDNRGDSGSFNGGARKSSALIERMRQGGIEIVQPSYLGLRVNHRKLAVFDGARAIVMGANVGGNYLLPLSDGWTYHDLAMRLDGPIVQDLARIFIESWVAAGGARLPLPPRPPPASMGEYTDAQVQAVVHAGNVDRNVERELVQRIDSAKERVYLANGFSMTRSIRDALLRARSRGVEVHWLWGEVSRDATIMAQTSFNALSEAGVQVHHWPGYLHMKLYVVDDYVVFGSSNLDGFSMSRNDELALQIHSKALADQLLASVFSPGIAESKPATGPVSHPDGARELLVQMVLEPWANRL